MQIRFLEIAQIELDEAIDYYNYEESGFGGDFLTEVLKSPETGCYSMKKRMYTFHKMGGMEI